MNKILLATIVVLGTVTQTYAAGTVERACLSSGRAANRAVCGCIQDVANLTLTGSDQKMASSFFKDPQKAQDVRQSDRRSHEEFWLRYKQFGAFAQQLCGR